MQDYDEYEPDGEEMVDEVKTAGSGIKVDIAGYALERIETAVVAGVRGAISDKIERMIQGEIADLVAVKLEEAIGKLSEDAIMAYLTKPRSKTNAYGEPTGGTMTLGEQIPEKIEQYLSDKVNSEGRKADYYDKKAQTRLDWYVNKLVRDELDIATKKAAADVSEQAKKVVAAHVGRFVAEQMIPQIDVSKSAA